MKTAPRPSTGGPGQSVQTRQPHLNKVRGVLLVVYKGIVVISSFVFDSISFYFTDLCLFQIHIFLVGLHFLYLHVYPPPVCQVISFYSLHTHL